MSISDSAFGGVVIFFAIFAIEEQGFAGPARLRSVYAN